MKLLDLSLLKVASKAQIQKTVDKVDLIITDENDFTKVAEQLGVKSVDSSKV